MKVKAGFTPIAVELLSPNSFHLEKNSSAALKARRSMSQNLHREANDGMYYRAKFYPAPIEQGFLVTQEKMFAACCSISANDLATLFSARRRVRLKVPSLI